MSRTRRAAAPEKVVLDADIKKQEFLFARFPLLCLDPTPQVARMAQVAAVENCRWRRRQPTDSPAAFLQRRVPKMFIEDMFGEQRKPQPAQDPAPDELEKLKERLEKQFGVSGKT